MERSRPLSSLEINRYKALLEKKYAELTRLLPRHGNIAADRMPDPIDEAILSTSREVEARALDASSILLREVIAALRRIQSEDYGACAGCGQQISANRLDAVPWTPFCIRCQEELEQEGPRQASLSEAA